MIDELIKFIGKYSVELNCYDFFNFEDDKNILINMLISEYKLAIMCVYKKNEVNNLLEHYNFIPKFQTSEEFFSKKSKPEYLQYLLPQNEIYARSFTQHINMIFLLGKQLQKLYPNIIDVEIETINTNYPQLKHIRDSIAHLDERILQQKKEKGKIKSIELQQSNIPGITAKSLFVTGGFINGAYSWTVEDGSTKCLHIDEETLLFFYERVTNILNIINEFELKRGIS